MSDELTPKVQSSSRGATSRSLIKRIFDSESPEQIVRTIPAQSLFLAIKQGGLSSSVDLIDICTIDQCRLLLDFDCWDRDQFNEDNFFEWLALTDASDSLRILQKLFKAFDLKLVALMMARHVQVEFSEEPSDNPPGPNFYTPDNGRTWLHITLEDADKQFYLGRLLALIFETSTDLFYQLLSIPGVSTASILEEDSYNERCTRLTTEGVPSIEYAAQLHAPLPDPLFDALLEKAEKPPLVENISAIEPLVFDTHHEEPLRSLIKENNYNESFLTELTLIMNGALVFFGADLSDLTTVQAICERVKGAINLGFEIAEKRHKGSASTLYQQLGLQPLYRSGLTRILSLRKGALKISEEDALLRGAEAAVIRQGLTMRFPAAPSWIASQEQKASSDGKVVADFKPISNNATLDLLKQELQKLTDSSNSL